MRKWFQQLLQDEDGEADEMALLSIVGVLVFLTCMLLSVIMSKDHLFDAQSAGIGLGAAIGAAATGMGWKRKLENPPTKDGDA